MFHDEYGLTHAVPNEISENGPLFTVEEMLLEQMLIEKHGKSIGKLFKVSAASVTSYIWNHEEKRYQDRGGVAGLHFSHDNMLAIYTLSTWSGWLPKSGLDEQLTDPRYFAHPRDRLFYGVMEKKWWAVITYPLIWLTLLAVAVQSCLRPISDTSGKLLWFVRTRTMINKELPMAELFYSIINRVVEYRHGDYPWVKIFAIYFPYDNHPSNILARKIWME